jgi:FolB domain-containing protein
MRLSAEHQIHVEQLKAFARVGVTALERAKKQRVIVTMTVWPVRDLRDLSDAVGRTVDYARLCRETKTFLVKHPAKLVETLADTLASHLLRKFGIRKVILEIRKFALKDAAYVSVIVTRRAFLD